MKALRQTSKLPCTLSLSLFLSPSAFAPEKISSAGTYMGGPVNSDLLSQSQGCPLSYPAALSPGQCLLESRCRLRHSERLASFCTAGSRAAGSLAQLKRTKASRGCKIMSSPSLPPHPPTHPHQSHPLSSDNCKIAQKLLVPPGPLFIYFLTGVMALLPLLFRS